MDGIFLGAGASYEVGMPLVWEFTDVIRKNILKEKMELCIFNVMYMVIREKYNTDIILLDMKAIN